MDSGIEIVYQVIDYNRAATPSDPITVQVSKTNILAHVSFEITTPDLLCAPQGDGGAIPGSSSTITTQVRSTTSSAKLSQTS